jgi:ABC-type sugar transport system permease subunit
MTNGAEPVTIRDIDVPFWRIVTILIKWSIAAIPAAIIVAILYALILGLLGGVVAGIFELVGIPIPEAPTPPAQP